MGDQEAIGKDLKSMLPNLIKQFVKFGMVGASNTLISLGINYIFILINNDLYLVGYVVGFFVSVINAYFLNTRFVFKNTDANHNKVKTGAFIKTFVVYGGTFLLGFGMLYLLKDVMGVSEFLAPILNLIVTVPLNFFFIRCWALKPSENSRG